MSKQFVIIVAIVLAGLFGLFTATKKDNGSTKVVGQVTNHVQGKSDSKVELIEYGDLQCPACGEYYPIVKALKDEYKTRVRFVFRHYPLIQIHNSAFIAARAAEAAGDQGKFFEMHDLMYENQSSWSSVSDPSSIFEQYAQQLGLNLTKYKADVTAESTAANINADLKEAQSTGSTSTPTFVLNGKRLEPNPRDINAFKKLLDAALKSGGQ